MRSLLLALVLLLVALPAQAIPVAFVAAAIGISATGFAAAAITFALNFVLSMVISFVAQSLLRPNQQKPGAQGGSSSPVIDNKLTVRQATAARQIIYGQTRVGGIYGLMHVTNNNNHLHLIILLAGHECEEIGDIWFNDEVVPLDGSGNVSSGKFNGKARILKHLGAADQVADATLMAEAPDIWTANDRLRGIAYIYVRLTYNADVYATGVPNITAVIKGKKVYDPRSALTAWSANSALCVADYLCDTVYGLPVDYDTGIDETALIAAANASDEDVDLADGNTEARYQADGVMPSSAQPQEILGRLLASMHGKAPYDGEQWKIIAGVYQTPTLSTFTDDELRAGPKIKTLTSRRDLFNAVKGTFVGPDNNWQEADFPVVASETYRELDGGQALYKDIVLPFTRSPARAQRIAKIDLLKARQQIIANMPCKLSAWRAQAGDTILWTSERYGWTDKPFEVSRCQFAVDSSTGEVGVDLELRETAAAVYDWTSNEESTIDPAPNTDFPDVFNVLPPSNLTVSETLYTTRDGGGVKAKVTLAWEASPDAFVQSGGGYLCQYKLSDDAVWVTVTDDNFADLTVDIFDVDPGIYDFRVYAVNWAGVRAEMPLALSRAISGLAAPPSAPVNLTVVAMESFALARCSLSPDLDVRQGGFIEFRHSSATTGATWDTALSLCDPLPAISGAWALPLKAGTYLAKFYDSSGIPSPTAASFVQTQSSAHVFTTLPDGVSEFAPVFAGTKSGVTVSDDDALTLDGGGLISEVPLISELPSIAFAGGAEASGYIDYDEIMDLGGVERCRLTSTVESEIRAVLDRIRARTTLVSTWPRVGSGVTGDEGDSWLLVATTQDDPGGTPTWTEWERLDASTYQARAFKFRRVLESYDSSFTPAILLDDVVAEGV